MVVFFMIKESMIGQGNNGREVLGIEMDFAPCLFSYCTIC